MLSTAVLPSEVSFHGAGYQRLLLLLLTCLAIAVVVGELPNMKDVKTFEKETNEAKPKRKEIIIIIIIK